MINPCQYCKYPRGTDSNVGYICQPTDLKACLPCRKVAELDAKIQQAQEAVIEMEKERQQWKVQVNANHDILTNHVPTEITEMILQFCLPNDILNTDLQFAKEARCTLGAPLVLSAVSHRWRGIAFSTPQLWTTVALRLKGSNQTSLAVLAKEWMERSGQLPLSISICMDNTNGRLDPKAIHELIELVNQYSARWMDLKFDGESEMLSAFSSTTEGISRLHTLHLMVNLSSTMGTLDLGKFVLQPKRLVLEGLFSLREINIDWSLLTDLVIERHLGVAECLEVLRRAPRLTSCSLAPSPDLHPPDFAPPHEPILCRDITDLTLFKFDSCDIVAHLLCPSLTTLTLNYFSLAHSVQRMVEFFQNSKCSVTKLVLNTVALSEFDLSLLCQGAPALHHLHMELSKPYAILGNYICSLLKLVSSIDGRMVPRNFPELRSLIIRHDDVFDWALLPLIFRTPQESERHRRELESVEILAGRSMELPCKELEIEEWTREQLLSLREEGVAIKIQGGCNEEDLL